MAPAPLTPAQLERLFPGDSEMARRMRAFDWSSADLGPPNDWPDTLRVALGICLTSRFPMHVWWGPSLTLFYNDAYISFLGPSKHPAVLGRSGREAWAEVWETIGPMIERVRSAGQASWSEDMLMFFDRELPKEEVYVTFSFSPVLNENGVAEGLFCACTEGTAKLLGNRRLDTLNRLGSRAEARTVEQVYDAAVAAIRANPNDIPFAAIYADDEHGHSVRIASIGEPEAKLQLPGSIRLSDDDTGSPWPLRAAHRERRMFEVDLSDEPEIRLQSGLWPEPIRKAVVVPIRPGSHDTLAGLLVAGVSPRRPFDDAYRAFLELVASQVGSAVADARAYEQERARAETLAELDRAKTAFFNNVSHEFRSPLTLLLGPLEEELRSNPASRERLTIVHKSALRLLRLVNTLLDFSRIQEHRLQAYFQPIDLSAYTAELASVFRSAIETAGLRLSIACPPLSAAVRVDREMWEKIVLNLVSNALKHTFEGQIEVTLQELERHVELSVADTGVGIPEAELTRIFDRFYRVRGARARTHEGTGIGLALLAELVKLHGGEVRVQSAEDRGAKFTVSIPFARSPLQSEEEVVEAPDFSATSAAIFAAEAESWVRNLDALTTTPPPSAAETRATILLVDDNADMRAYVGGLLQEQRYTVIRACDGAEALAAARRTTPDLVLADVMMPRLDGFGLLKALRADARLSSVPFILLSARAGDESSLEGLQLGADDYLVKPFGARELLARVATHLELAAMRAAATNERERADAARLELMRKLETAHEDERHRVARDLHDQVGQTVTVMSLLLKAARDSGRIDPDVSAKLVEVQKLADRLSRELHSLATRLRPTALDDLGLSSALDQLVADWSAHTQIPVDLQEIERDGCRLPLAVETVLYRLVQESLTNVAKHAQAQHVSVVLSRHAGHVIVMVEDDGVGFDQRRITNGRIGILGMRERVMQLGGSFDVESTPAQGTTILARVPLQSAMR